MDTFLRLASLGTLLLGLQLLIPESSSANAIGNQLRKFSCPEQSASVLPIYNDYDPPNNGAPSEGGQGSGTR